MRRRSFGVQWSRPARRAAYRTAQRNCRAFFEQHRLVPPRVLESVGQQGALPVGHDRHVALAGLPLGPAQPHQLVAGVGALGPRCGAQLGAGCDAEGRARGVAASSSASSLSSSSGGS